MRWLILTIDVCLFATVGLLGWLGWSLMRPETTHSCRFALQNDNVNVRVSWEFWPNQRVKSCYREHPNDIVIHKWSEDGILVWDSWGGNPGPVRSVKVFDKQGVLKEELEFCFVRVADFSEVGDEIINEKIRRTIWDNDVVGVYARWNQALTDPGFAKLAAFKTLEWIDITGCKNITQRGINEFKKALPNCEVRR